MVEILRDVSRILLVAAALAGSAPAAATTIVPIPDHGLVDRAPVIVTGRVEARLPGPGDRAVTRWLVRVERELKGTGLPSAIVLELPGGSIPGGATLRVVRPLALHFWGGVWTIAAWCELRTDFRTFRLDRVGMLALTDDRFAAEPGRMLEDYMARVTADRPK